MSYESERTERRRELEAIAKLRARAEAVERERDNTAKAAAHSIGLYEAKLARVREQFELLRNGPDTLTQAGLRIVNDTLAILDGEEREWQVKPRECQLSRKPCAR